MLHKLNHPFSDVCPDLHNPRSLGLDQFFLLGLTVVLWLHLRQISPQPHPRKDTDGNTQAHNQRGRFRNSTSRPNENEIIVKQCRT